MIQEDVQTQQLHHKKQIKTTFVRYEKDMQSSYASLFSTQKLNKYFEILRQNKRQKMLTAIQANQEFLNMIISCSQQGQQQLEVLNETSCVNFSKIRSTIKQFYRQWCSQSPQLKDCKNMVEYAKKYIPSKGKIVVPGCGLGRLVLQLVEAGFATQGNQVTYFMLYGSNFILNNVSQKQQFKIYPFIHSLNSYEKDQDIFRQVLVPDKVASQCVNQDSDFSMVAGQFTEIYGNLKTQEDKFDGLISFFFIDTANNIFAYIDTIYSCLRKNGIWINFGPLLYHYRQILNEVSIQVSWQCLRKYIETKFQFLEEEFILTTYCHDQRSNYSAQYKCIRTVCRKKQ